MDWKPLLHRWHLQRRAGDVIADLDLLVERFDEVGVLVNEVLVHFGPLGGIVGVGEAAEAAAEL